MQIVIEVPDDLKDTCDNDDIDEAMKHVTWFSLTLALAIRDGIVLPEQQAKKMAIEALSAQNARMSDEDMARLKKELAEAEPCDEQSVYVRAYREGYDKGYADGDFFARHENETKESCEDAVRREAVLDAIDKWVKDKSTFIALAINEGMSLLERIKALPPVTPKPLDSVLDEIRAEIEPKCDRINSLASVLPYTAHREIQELLCEIMDLCKAESSKTEQGLAHADQEAMMPAT